MALNPVVMVNHASITLVGRDTKGTYTQTWITTSQPFDLMSELQKYTEQFPDLEFIEVLIVLNDKERNRPIRFVEKKPHTIAFKYS